MADIDYEALLKMTAASRPLKVKQRKARIVKAVPPPDTKNITERLRSDGSPSYLVNLRLQKDGSPWVYRETFDTLAEAVAARDAARETYRAGGVVVAVTAQLPLTMDVLTKQTVADIIALRLEQGKVSCCRFCGHEDTIATKELEHKYDKTEVQPRVQNRSREAGDGSRRSGSAGGA